MRVVNTKGLPYPAKCARAFNLKKGHYFSAPKISQSNSSLSLTHPSVKHQKILSMFKWRVFCVEVRRVLNWGGSWTERFLGAEKLWSLCWTDVLNFQFYLKKNSTQVFRKFWAWESLKSLNLPKVLNSESVHNMKNAGARFLQ